MEKTSFEDTLKLLGGIAKQTFNPQRLRREWHMVLQDPYRRVTIIGDLSNKKFQLVGKTAWVSGMEVLERLGQVDKRFVTLLADPREGNEEV
jgi:hypothetical protein